MSSRVPACQISTFYYVGFAYMMMRRYQDAIRTFSNILLYIQRTKQMFQNKTYLYDQVIFSNTGKKSLHTYRIAVGKKINTCLPDRWINKMNKCTPCWRCAWSFIRWGLMRVSILSWGKSLEIVCCECKRGNVVSEVFLFNFQISCYFVEIFMKGIFSGTWLSLRPVSLMRAQSFYHRLHQIMIRWETTFTRYSLPAKLLFCWHWLRLIPLHVYIILLI